MTTTINLSTKLEQAVKDAGFAPRAITVDGNFTEVVLDDGRTARFGHLYLSMASMKLLRAEVKRRFTHADDKH